MQELCPEQSCGVGAGACKVPALQCQSLLSYMKPRSIDLGSAVHKHLGHQEFEDKRKPAARWAGSIICWDDLRLASAIENPMYLTSSAIFAMSVRVLNFSVCGADACH
ncbi:hypothetical protein D0894_12015 [Pseudomonas monteilii]|uniref:Uncharacterized protein n=1 Tax=Pseudomonas monteilii TaxID=76759 RepID=A0A399M6C0_9PSED|nr:hypothetical protein D0894_12015 [Pseudomonas monteilii]